MAEEIPSLKKVLERSLRDLGLQKRLKVEQIAVLWPTIVGTAVAKISSASQFRNGTLFIDVADSIWMQELKFQEGELIRRVNATLGEPLVHRLFLRLARSPAPAAPPPAAVDLSPAAPQPLSPQQELTLDHELASVRDPELRAVLKDFRRRLLQIRPASSP